MASEDAFIKKILPFLSRKNLLPGNDDAVAWKTPESEKNSVVVIKTDSIAWSTDACPDTMTFYQFGMKLVSVVVSDVISKGSRPYYFLSTITIPKEFTDESLESIFKGLLDGCKLYSLDYMGGDLGSSKEIVLTGIVVGYVSEKTLLKRSTMQVNDLVCTTGYFGYTGLGFRKYLEHASDEISKVIMQIVDKKLLYPKARSDWLLYLQKYASATIDSSDGLAKSLEHLTTESNKQIVIENIPAFPELKDIFREDSSEYLKATLFAGEEFEIVFSISEAKYNLLIKELQIRGESKPVVIGRVTKGEGLVYKGDKLQFLKSWNSLEGEFKS